MEDYDWTEEDEEGTKMDNLNAEDMNLLQESILTDYEHRYASIDAVCELVDRFVKKKAKHPKTYKTTIIK